MSVPSRAAGHVLRGDEVSGRKGKAERGVRVSVRAGLAPRLMPMEGRQGAVLSDQGSPRKGGLGRRPCGTPSPPRGQPRHHSRCGRRWHRLEKGNRSPHSSLWKEMPSSGGGRGGGTVCVGGRSPSPCRRPRRLRPPGRAAPRPAQACAQGRVREGHLWWFAGREGGREGGAEEGRGGAARSGPGGGPGGPASLPECPALSHLPGAHRSSLCPEGAGRKGGRWDFFFFSFFPLFGNKKTSWFRRNTLCNRSTVGEPCPPAPPHPVPPRAAGGERGLWGRGRAWGVGPPQPHGLEEKRRGGGRGPTLSPARRRRRARR